MIGYTTFYLIRIMRKGAACPAFTVILARPERILLFFKLHQLGEEGAGQSFDLHCSAGSDDFICCVSALLNTLEFACSEFDLCDLVPYPTCYLGCLAFVLS